MSSKAKTTSTKEDATPALVPNLRFPEFRDVEGWKETQLRKIARPVTDRAVTGDGDNVLTLSAEYGLVLQSDYFGKKIAGDSTERYIKLLRNDFVYNDRTTKASTFGTIKRLSKYPSGIVSPIYKCFRFLKDENPVFWEWYFESGRHDAPLSGLVNEGARAGRFNISITQFLSTVAWRPDEAEQQKIAECLSSVDELIAAQARKLDALKTHKKGLMQQLFPREGEAVPRLRFPEFQSEGDWKILPLAALAEKIMVGIASAATHAYRETGVPMLRNQNIKEGKIDDSSLLFIDPNYEATHKSKRLRAGDVITVRTGYPGLSAVVTKLYENAQCFTSLITRPKIDVLDSDYLCIFINSPIGKQFMLGAEAGGAQKNVNAGTLETLEVYLPQLEEQRKIASCLSSLDALIAAETQKLEALKTHKKGLMQQLFPSPQEVEA
jgi:type I restriction enzyme S subunit